MATKRKVKRTERGWRGHFVGSHQCLFSRNTLIETEETKYIVSTIGAYYPEGLEKGCSPLGGGSRYYETMIFEAKQNENYWDVDIEKQFVIPDGCNWYIDTITYESDKEANDNHDEIVSTVQSMLENDKYLLPVYNSLDDIADEINSQLE